jgi:hypothetical protein
MRYSDLPEGETLRKLLTDRYQGNRRDYRPAIAALAFMCLLTTACDAPAPEAAANAPASDVACAEDGRLKVELYGGIQASIDWQADELACTGMPRPNDQGARVRLSGPLGSGAEVRTLAFILGLRDLEVGQTGAEFPTNVTLIEEGTGRFFSSRDTSDCWTDVSRQEPISTTDERTFRIEGTLYCVSPLAELNGSTSVTFTELKFTGRLTWEQPE